MTSLNTMTNGIDRLLQFVIVTKHLPCDQLALFSFRPSGIREKSSGIVMTKRIFHHCLTFKKPQFRDIYICSFNCTSIFLSIFYRSQIEHILPNVNLYK